MFFQLDGIIERGGVGMKVLSRIRQRLLQVKRLLGRAVEWFKSRSREASIEDYYYSGGETLKNRRARSIDRMFSRVVFFAAAASGTYLLVENLSAALFFAAGCTCLFHWTANSRRDKRVRRNRERMLEKEAVERFLKLTSDMDSGEFFNMVKEWLDRSGLCSATEVIRDTDDRPLLITGEFRGQRAGVYAKKLKPDTMVKKDDLDEFVQYCLSRGLENGIYIAAGSFDYSAREYAAGLESFNLYIADTGAIYRAFIKKGYVFSMEDLQSEMEQRVLEQDLEERHSLGKVLAFRRIRTYAVLSILIAAYSVMVPYTLYYILVSLILLCLSVTALVRWEVERLREEAENSIRLDNVMETE
jgi:predicted membrane protein